MFASADARHKMPVEHLSKIVIYELNGQTASACRGARRAGHDDAAASTSLLTYMHNPCNSCAPRASYSCNRRGWIKRPRLLRERNRHGLQSQPSASSRSRQSGGHDQVSSCTRKGQPGRKRPSPLTSHKNCITTVFPERKCNAWRRMARSGAAVHKGEAARASINAFAARLVKS